MGALSRRAMMSLLAAGSLVVLASCSPVPSGPSRSTRATTPVPTPTPSAADSALPPLLSGRAAPSGPLAGAEFGPNGTHWPSRTPALGDAFDLVVEADCTWNDISNAIAFVTERTPQGKGCVLVRPGTLPGFGAGSSKPPALHGVGVAGRPYRVLVAPRDGSDSVTVSGSIRIDRVSGVAFVGFWLFPESVVLTSVQDFAWAWSKGQAFNITAGDGGPASQIELVECVTPEAKMTDADVWAVRTGDSPWNDISVVGCYLAPSYKAAGSEAHCDTFQLSGSAPGSGLAVRDTVMFASTNAGFIPSDRTTGILFDHTLIVAGDRMLMRYPLPAGANPFTSGTPAAVNAAGTYDAISGRASTFIGNVRGQWLSVEDCVTSIPRPPAASWGGFVSDTSLAAVDGAWLDARAPVPTDDALRQAWGI